MPQLIKYLPQFTDKQQQFDLAMKSIFKFMTKKEKDKKEALLTKGCGYVALGKISNLVSNSFFTPHLD